MTRKPLFWVLFALLSTVGAVFAFKFFPRAYPIVNLDLRMDRQTALRQAEALAQRYHWGPDRARVAASFDLDEEVQTFMELEGGGREAYLRMMAQGLYSPYTWRVRHFKEYTTTETTVVFSPEGNPYGFTEKVPENQAGPALAPEAARRIAEEAARSDWGIHLSEYQMVEQSKETRPNGRVDHTFTYERPKTLGEGRIRLSLGVSGDRLTGLRQFVKVPEAFTRRYEQMRSANTTIATVGMIAMALLYIVGGCFAGLFLLTKRRALLWRPALRWGLIIGALQGLLVFNALPLAWMQYRTEVSAHSFLFQQGLQAVFTTLGEGLLLTLTFMAAEGLTRWALPEQIQLWKLWDRDAAASPQVAGRTWGGYLAVGLFLAYDVAIYLFFSKSLHWWTPSEALFDPNILATYLPWLSPLAQALHAGFWEECLFRAIPLAGAVLIGRRLGWKRTWLFGAFVIQALIFGSGHATYPNQPAYARVVELIIPSIAFGLIYLNWGLLPGIILHFIFDAVLMSIPLFVSAAPGIWISRTCVILLTLVPVWVLLYHRFRNGHFAPVGEQLRNSAWTAPPVEAKSIEDDGFPQASMPYRGWHARVALLAGLVGLGVWIFAVRTPADAPRLALGRSRAEAIAREELAKRSIVLGPQWRTLATVNANQELADKFVWRTAGPKVYAALMGSYITPPHWTVRFARFTGDVSERAEEYAVCIAPGGGVYRFIHELPESRPGQNLDQMQAKALADAEVQTHFQQAPGTLKDVSAVPQKHPARTDWTFTYADEEHYHQAQGQARIEVKLAGAMVSDASRTVHVPEEWKRQEDNRETTSQILKGLCALVVVLLILGSIVLVVLGWTRKQFAPRVFLVVAALLFALKLLDLFLKWPSLIARFETSTPFGVQVLMEIGLPVVGILFTAAGLGLMAGFAHGRLANHRGLVAFPWAALAWGALGAGALAIAKAAGSRLGAHWPNYEPVAAWLPPLSTALGFLNRFLNLVILWLMIVAAIDWLTRGGQRLRILSLGLLAILGFLIAGVTAVDSIGLWLASGSVLALFLMLGQMLVLAREPAAVPWMVAGLLVLSMVSTAFHHAYPGAIAGGILGIILVVLAAGYWHRALKVPSGSE